MIIKRDVHVCFSILKPSIKIRLWHTQTFERLKMSLIRWLDGEIQEGEKIRRIVRLVSVFNRANENSEPTRFWESVKIDNDVCDMMFEPDDIVLMVIIS